MRVGLFSGRAPWNPDAHRPGCRSSRLQNGRIDNMPERCECVRIAKKTGYVDQQVLIESLHLARIPMQQVAIIVEFVDLLQGHPALNTASYCGRFVPRE